MQHLCFLRTFPLVPFMIMCQFGTHYWNTCFKILWLVLISPWTWKYFYLIYDLLTHHICWQFNHLTQIGGNKLTSYFNINDLKWSDPNLDFWIEDSLVWACEQQNTKKWLFRAVHTSLKGDWSRNPGDIFWDIRESVKRSTWREPTIIKEKLKHTQMFLVIKGSTL